MMTTLYAPFLTDFYKTGHIRQEPEGTELTYSNMTARSDRHFQGLPDFDHKTVWFGLQGVCSSLLIEIWNETFFKQPRQWNLDKIKEMMDTALGPGAVSLDQWGKLWDLGFLPVKIKALPEGTRVNLRVPYYTIQNTHGEDFAWVTNYLETQMSAEIWHMIYTATMAYEYKRLVTKYAKETGTDLASILFQCHGFEFRGMEDIWGATKGGAGHLLSFLGTDTISSIAYLKDYYPDPNRAFIGGSVPASEHAVMCLSGKLTEIQTYRRLINDVYPTGIVSIVSDTWDFWRVVTEYTVELKDEILARGPNGPQPGKVVLRPDSGDPVKIIIGDMDAPVGSPQYKGAVECLWDIFGGTTTSAGYMLLDSHIGLIYGDSITLDRATRILEGLKKKGFASGNIVFGVGSYTYQFATRDTFGNAIKMTAGIVKGEFRAISKDPKTDDGVKKSAEGLIRVELENGNYVMYDNQTWEQEARGELKLVFEDGKLINPVSYTTVRERLAETLN